MLDPKIYTAILNLVSGFFADTIQSVEINPSCKSLSTFGYFDKKLSELFHKYSFISYFLNLFF